MNRPVTRKEQYLAKAAGVISGDTPPAVTKEEQYLKKIADNITDLTENPLPEVSSEDEGKVPVVGSDGKWELGTPSGGGGLAITISVDDTDPLSPIYTMDKTFAEIEAAVLSGIIPMVLEDASSDEFTAYQLNTLECIGYGKGEYDGKYLVVYYNDYIANSKDDYPTYQEGK